MNDAHLLLDTLQLRRREDPTALRDAWRTARTSGLPDLVRFEGCALWLFRRLNELGLAANDLRDGTFWEWLHGEAKRIAATNLLVDTEAASVARFLAEREVPFVMLKGVARRAARDRYPYAETKATSDVDVLVPAAHSWAIWEAMLRKGYRHAEIRTDRTVHHLPPLQADTGVPVELHVSTSRRVWPPDAWDRLTAGPAQGTVQGLTVPVPSATEMLWHGLSHSADLGTPAFKLRLLLDGATVLAGRDPIDWAVIRSRIDSPEIADPRLARAWLGAAATLSGPPLPETLAGAVPPFPVRRILRWRLRVSRRSGLSSRWGEKLREEGTREEMDVPPMPSPHDATLWLKARRAAAVLAARGVYRAWRLAHS